MYTIGVCISKRILRCTYLSVLIQFFHSYRAFHRGLPCNAYEAARTAAHAHSGRRFVPRQPSAMTRRPTGFDPQPPNALFLMAMHVLQLREPEHTPSLLWPRAGRMRARHTTAQRFISASPNRLEMWRLSPQSTLPRGNNRNVPQLASACACPPQQPKHPHARKPRPPCGWRGC